MKISVVMPACPWPDPKDPNGDPHPYLPRAIASCVETLEQVAVELLIGIDGRAAKLAELASCYCLLERAKRKGRLYDGQFSFEVRMFPFAGRWGNNIRNTLLQQASGDLIAFMDHDDCFYPHALDRIARIGAEHPVPLIFKMSVYTRCGNGSREPAVLWREKGRVERKHIGGHQLVVPNMPHLLGRWQPEEQYTADFDWIQTTLARFHEAGLEPLWSEEFIAKVRPWKADP